jgi:hypothetical protein
MPKVWINDKTIFDPIIVLGDDALVTASLQSEELEDAKSRIEGGESPLNLFGDRATMIPYFSIKKLKLEESDEDIEVYYKKEKEDKSKTLDAVDKTVRQEILAEIQSHLSDDFTSMTEKYGLMRALFPSLMTLTVFIIITRLLHGVAVEIAAGAEPEISGRHSGLKSLFLWVVDLLGPTGALIFGGLFMLFPLLVIVKRIKKPTIITTIKQGKQKPGSVIGTTIKWAILVGVWYLFGPGIIAAFIS